MSYLVPEMLKIREEFTVGIAEADLDVTLRTMQVLYRRFSVMED